jgi:hypothetical protein
MAQSALTVTTPNPTPPTNMAFTGTTGPNPPNYQRNTYATPFGVTPGAGGQNPTPPPFFDDLAGGAAPSGPAFGGTASVMPAFKTNTAALTAGTSANDTGTGTTISTAATGAGGNGVNSVAGTYIGAAAGAVPASTSVAHEGATDTLVVQRVVGALATNYNPATFLPYTGDVTGVNTSTGPTGPWQMVTCSCGPALAAPAVGNPPISPNQLHASSLSPATNPTISATPATALSPSTIASGTNTFALTVTGVGFTPQSVVYINGIPQTTVYVSSTSLTVAAALKKATAGTFPVTVVTGGVVVTANAPVMTYT